MKCQLEDSMEFRSSDSVIGGTVVGWERELKVRRLTCLDLKILRNFIMGDER